MPGLASPALIASFSFSMISAGVLVMLDGWEFRRITRRPPEISFHEAVFTPMYSVAPLTQPSTAITT
jgi:hypothetical protein